MKSERTFQKVAAAIIVVVAIAMASRLWLHDTTGVNQAANHSRPAQAEIVVPHPELQTPVKVGEWSRWENIWGRAMWVRPSRDGVVYEVKGARGKLTKVTVEESDDGFVRYYVAGKAEPLVLTETAGKAHQWGKIIGFDAVQVRIQPTKREVTYHMTNYR